MKFIILSIALVSILSACAKQGDKPHQPTSQEMQDRNDTSGHPTDIGNNKAY